jgi:ADP-ribose pyrophosphatase
MSSYKINKLTDCTWVNLFEVHFTRKNQPDRSWLMCSRKNRPVTDVAKADIVVIVATTDTPQGKRLVVTKEFRVPLWDYEYGFPTGLIDDGEDAATAAARELKEETGLDLVKVNHVSLPVFSSAGLTDESCHMVLAEARGQASDRPSADDEDIEVLLLDVEGIRDLLASKKKIAAKAWGLLYHYAATGRID